MTRVTNFGRKRTHLEAGFSNENDNDLDALGTSLDSPPTDYEGILGTVNSGDVSEALAPPKKKKRIRTPKTKRDGYAAQRAAEAARGEGEATTSNADTSAAGVNMLEISKQASTSASGNCTVSKLGPSKSAKKKKRNQDRRDKVQSATESRRLKRVQEKLADTTCYACRERGHAAKDCRTADGNKEGGRKATAVGICYRCGSTTHSLSRCKRPNNTNDPFPFASCFVCSGKGHLASACPQNKAKGVYPNGGCCKLCGDTSHLARDCTIRQKVTDPTAVLGTGSAAGADEDDFHTLRRTTNELERSEKEFEKVKKMAELQSGVLSGKVVQFGDRPQAVKKVVMFK